ncbi:hypothetical protein P4S72_27845 [Vibrio sp. PP-XX7]
MIYAKSVAALEAQIKSGLQSTVQAAATTIQAVFTGNLIKKLCPPARLFANGGPVEAIRQASNDVRYMPYICAMDQCCLLSIPVHKTMPMGTACRTRLRH